jgi:hypothetical protein
MHDPERTIQQLHRSGEPDPTFRRVLEAVAPASDADLADLITLDAALRSEAGRPIDLERYLLGVPDLRARADPLDAAISCTLRAMRRAGIADPAATLERRYPDLRPAIRDAALIDEAMVSTDGLGAVLRTRPSRRLPSDFGPPLPDGRRRFRLTGFLGAGAHGEVYRAEDRAMSGPGHTAQVALKIIRRGAVDDANDPEAAQTRRVDHPNVVRVIDRGLSPEGEHYIVYELLDGPSLAAAVRQGHAPMAPRLAARLIAAIARGVQAAHTAGLVHCDLKPSNILLDQHGVPHVADFSVSIWRGRDGRHHPSQDPSDASVLGNLAFISPEQFRREPGWISPATDIYALGGMLYWLLTGHLPNGHTPEQVARAHARPSQPGSPARAPGPRDRLPHLCEDLDAIVRRALAPDARDRHLSAAALAADLEDWLGHHPIRWKPTPWHRRGLLLVRRQPRIIALSAALALALLVGAAISVYMLVERSRTEAARRIERARADGVADRMRDASHIVRSVFSAAGAVEPAPDLPDDPVDPREALDVLTRTLGVWTATVGPLESLARPGLRRSDLLALRALLLRSEELAWRVTLGADNDIERDLDQCRQRWQRYLPPEHPWAQNLELLAHTARLRRILSVETGGPPTPPDPAELARLESSLAVHFERTRGHPRSLPFAVIACDALADLYGPQLLNRPELAALWRRTERDLLEEIEQTARTVPIPRTHDR